VTRYALRIGDITISVAGDETFDIAEPTARFLVPPETSANLDIQVTRGVPATPAGNLIFDSGGVWKLFRDGGRNVFTFSSPAFPSDPYKTASFNDAFTIGDVVLSADVPPGSDPLAYPLDELLAVHILGAGGGLEFHACGLVVDGRGFLFVGQSGAGKTTTAQLWLQETSPTILSDDRIIVRETGGGLRMYGTPWHGEAEICTAADAPLTAVFLLEQSDVNEIRAVEPADAVARLFGCSFPLFHRAESVAQTLSLLCTITERGFVHELAFRRDVSAVRLVLGRNWS
jgi:hypothetical protein